jgi:hypothetical protein
VQRVTGSWSWNGLMVSGQSSYDTYPTHELITQVE